MTDEQHSRGAFDGLTEEEIEEQYRKNREIMLKQNKPYNKILMEGKIMMDETREDYKSNPMPYYVVGAILFGIILGWLLFSN